MSEETKTAEKPAAKRRLGPPRSRKKPDGWEDIREDDLLELPTPKEDAETEAEPQDDLWRCEPWADDEVPCLLVQRGLDGCEGETPLASCDAIEALCAVRPPPSVVKVPKDKVDEATRRALEDGVLAPHAEEVDGFSSRQVVEAATPSKHEVVRDLKSLLLGCARDPRWLAAMAGELDCWRMAAIGGITH